MRKNSRTALPKLLTAREYGHLIGRNLDWVKQACSDGRIPAAQMIANGMMWIIPEDALIKPRYLEGIDPKLLDIGLPDEMVLHGQPAYIPAPDYSRNVNKGNATKHRAVRTRKTVTLHSLERVRKGKDIGARELHRLSGVHTATIQKAEHGLPILAVKAVALADAMDVDVEELMQRGRV